MDKELCNQAVVSDRDETLRLFANPFLEYLSHCQPTTLIYIYLPIIMYLGYEGIVRTGTFAFALTFFAGISLWTLLEYLIHRYVFHFKAMKTWGNYIHSIHHAYPRDKTRLVTPPVVTLPLAALIGLGYYFIFGDYFWSVLAGSLLGYLAFDLIHFSVHYFNPKKNRIARYLKRYHFLHHYMDSEKGYGVTNPFWDYVFGTKPNMTFTTAMHQAEMKERN